jgi:hypothetical protein
MLLLLLLFNFAYKDTIAILFLRLFLNIQYKLLARVDTIHRWSEITESIQC